MQLDIMLFFQSVRSDFLDVLMNTISLFGEILIPLAVITIIYWCIDKKKGFVITLSILTALMTTQIVKSIVRYPRPFQAYPELIQGDRISTATGYSFPSGHSTLSSSFYPALYLAFRTKALLVIAIVLTIMVPVSRLYLGVHWPMDVICGTIIGLSSSILFARIADDITKDDASYRRYSMIYGIAAGIVSLVFTILLTADAVDHTAFSDLASNAAIASGAMIGFALESYFVRFRISGGMGKKVLNVAIGIILMVLVLILLTLIPMPHSVSVFVMMFAAGMWVSFLYPLIATRTGLMDHS